MKKILPTILIILITFFSCSEDDESNKTDEDYLRGTWTIKKSKTYYYLNGEPDTLKESILEEPWSTLNFNSNKEVTYSNPDYTKPVIGKWVLNDKVLRTDLKIDPGSSTGYGPVYFFPENAITLLNDTELKLISPMSLEATHSNGDKIKYYSETYLEK
ncbi:hypothetical protein [Salinimicrobium flavum]|uniref:Lipocalin-like domain-containing protein n=1 Tax=Salinimicrobium flavum TaxID=1737065 RepID=A0ABW5IYH5_9FLAO